jgi:hypothetical protein
MPRLAAGRSPTPLIPTLLIPTLLIPTQWVARTRLGRGGTVIRPSRRALLGSRRRTGWRQAEEECRASSAHSYRTLKRDG